MTNRFKNMRKNIFINLTLNRKFYVTYHIKRVQALFMQPDFSSGYIYIYIYVRRTVLIQKKWIPEPIFAAYWWMPVGSGQPCENSLYAMNLSIHGAVILARDFSVRWGKANSSPGIHDGNMIPAQTRRKKRLGFISPDHAAPDSPDLLPRPRGETARWDRGDRKKRALKTVRGRRKGQRGVMRQEVRNEAGNEASNKKREKDNRRQTATSGRLHEPEAAVYSIWQARYSSADSSPLPPPSHSIIPFADRRRMKYALAWISNGAANRIKLAMNLPTRSKRRRSRRERNRWSFEKEAMVCLHIRETRVI